jgi:hypothetical protein
VVKRAIGIKRRGHRWEYPLEKHSYILKHHATKGRNKLHHIIKKLQMQKEKPCSRAGLPQF